MDLGRLGLRPAIEAAFEEARVPGAELGRVTKVERGFASVITARAEGSFHVPKGLSGRGRTKRAARERDSEPPSEAIDRVPVTGDWVVVLPSKQVVEHVLPRFSQFIRRAAGKREEGQVVAANADRVFVLMGLDGDFNIRRLERYLALTSESGAAAVVLLTKASLAADVRGQIGQVEEVASGAPVHAIDVVTGIDPEAPSRYLSEGVTAALIGSSGVGKSTLANFLVGTEVARTREVRAHDERGKHTTSRREMFVLERGVIIDTPGMRELALWGESSSLEGAFPEIVGLAEGCRFSDCSHGTEPGCAVRAAVACGTLAETRLASYLQLAAELAARERKRRSDHPPRSRR